MFIHYAIVLSPTDCVLGGHFDVSDASLGQSQPITTGPDLDSKYWSCIGSMPTVLEIY